MRLLVLALAALCVSASRRLSLNPCDPTVFLLGHGAPAKRQGLTFGPQGIMDKLDARIDPAGHGRTQLGLMPSCLAEKAIPIKFLGSEGLKRALAWLAHECIAKDCVVYTSLKLKKPVGLELRIL